MAYCSYCAAVIDTTQIFCPRCGRPVPVAPSPVTNTIAADVRPPSVRTGVVLLGVTWIVGLIMFGVVSAIYPRVLQSTPYIFRTTVLSLAWITVVVCLWQRQSWARIGVLLLIAWSVGNLALSLIRFSGTSAPLWGLAVTVAQDIVRIVAVSLLFRPESNAWFKR